MKIINVVKAITIEFSAEEADLLEELCGHGLKDSWWSDKKHKIASSLWRLLQHPRKGQEEHL